MIAIGADHAGYALKEEIKKYLEEKKIKVKDCGCYKEEKDDFYPEFGKAVANAIITGECDKGIVVCGTGIGISISANKVRGIRAALCHTELEARLAREHNNANVLALGGRIIGRELAKSIVDSFVNTEFSKEERHKKRVDMIEE